MLAVFLVALSVDTDRLEVAVRKHVWMHQEIRRFTYSVTDAGPDAEDEQANVLSSALHIRNSTYFLGKGFALREEQGPRIRSQNSRKGPNG
jgi:hypothetical protein